MNKDFITYSVSSVEALSMIMNSVSFGSLQAKQLSRASVSCLDLFQVITTILSMSIVIVDL